MPEGGHVADVASLGSPQRETFIRGSLAPLYTHELDIVDENCTRWHLAWRIIAVTELGRNIESNFSTHIDPLQSFVPAGNETSHLDAKRFIFTSVENRAVQQT